MYREIGFYFVKAKQDDQTQGDLDILMGLCTPNEWTTAKWTGVCFKIGNYDLGEHLFEIDKDRLLNPDEMIAQKKMLESVRGVSLFTDMQPLRRVIDPAFEQNTSTGTKVFGMIQSDIGTGIKIDRVELKTNNYNPIIKQVDPYTLRTYTPNDDPTSTTPR